MVFQLISLATAFIGSSLAAAWDLKTTEIPDEIPHAMIGIALILYVIQSIISGSYWPILNSITLGGLLLGFGFLMYYLGQWGGGDAKILAAIGFLIPSSPNSVQVFFPFPISYLFNVFIIGATYMLVYAIVFAILNKKIIFEFSKDIKASANVLFLGGLALFAVFLAINWYISQFFGLMPSVETLVRSSIIPLTLTFTLFLVWKFAKIVEEVGFKKKIPLKKLKVGDVLLNSKLWQGITETELKKIKKSRKRFIWIKDGVRFAPTFPLALLFTLYFGDAIFIFFKILI